MQFGRSSTAWSFSEPQIEGARVHEFQLGRTIAKETDVSERNVAVRAMIRRLQDTFNETLDAVYDLPEEYLQQPCGHACARGGSTRDLLVHNIFHEKQHTGQVWNIRDELRLLQGWGGASLYPLLVDYYLSRAQLISSLFGLSDEQLDIVPPQGGWSVRQTIEHALGSERRSISALHDEYAESARVASGAGA